MKTDKNTINKTTKNTKNTLPPTQKTKLGISSRCFQPESPSFSQKTSSGPPIMRKIPNYDDKRSALKKRKQTRVTLIRNLSSKK